MNSILDNIFNENINGKMENPKGKITFQRLHVYNPA